MLRPEIRLQSVPLAVNAVHEDALREESRYVVRPPSNTDTIDIHLRAYRFFAPTPGTAAT